MADALTFNSCVDKCIKRTGRPDSAALADIQAYVRQTIRELQVTNYYHRDLIENQITALTDNYEWTRPDLFRIMRTVRYPVNHLSRYPPFKAPGQVQQTEFGEGLVDFYYGGPTYFIFSGIEANELIDLAYYKYAPRFIYYTTDLTRPAKFDDETGLWSFLNGGVFELETVTTLTQAQQDAAIAKVQNWLLLDWYEAVQEGALAKLFKQRNDDRARASFALFMQFKTDLQKGEAFETLDF